jgi:hypothetical protein
MMEEIRLLALDLSAASEQAIAVLVEDATGPEIFREILSSNTNRPEILKILVESPASPSDVREDAAKQLNVPVRMQEMPSVSDEGRKHGLLQRIQHLTVGERIAIALRGGQEIRSVLIKDSNKEVVLTVLKNPKITETEVEMIAHSRNVPEDALRAIHKNREWMKNYNINLALVNNPKTPPGIGITLVNTLRVKDLAILEKNRNVPEAIRAVARKLLQMKKTR